MQHQRRTLIRFVVAAMISAGSVVAVAGSSRAGPGINGPIAFGRFDPGLGDFRLWTAHADGSHQRPLTPYASSDPDWRPDGTGLAFDYFDQIGEHVATVDRDGTHRWQLTFGPGFQEIPRYSPDGRHIAYDASAELDPNDPAFTTDIWVMDANGSHRRQVTHAGFDVEPAWSPDGHWITFGRIVGPTSPTDFTQHEAVYVVRSDGSGLREVVPPMISLEHPHWSPDGRLITFNIAPEGTGAPNAGTVFSVHPDGRGLRVLLGAAADWAFTKAVWAPDGRWMLVVCHQVSANIDNLCRLNPRDGRFHIVVPGTPDRPVNMPAWGRAPL
jgi:hypothetical protein